MRIFESTKRKTVSTDGKSNWVKSTLVKRRIRRVGAHEGEDFITPQTPSTAVNKAERVKTENSPTE